MSKNPYPTSVYDWNYEDAILSKAWQEGFDAGCAIKPIAFSSRLPKEGELIIVIGAGGAASTSFDSNAYFADEAYYSQRITNDFSVFGKHWIPFPIFTK